MPDFSTYTGVTYICECGDVVETAKRDRHFCPNNNRINVNCSYCGQEICNIIFSSGTVTPYVFNLMGKPCCTSCQVRAAHLLEEDLDPSNKILKDIGQIL